MHIQDAVATWLITEYKKPGISFAKLFSKVFELFHEKNFHGLKLSGVHGNSRIENVMSKLVKHLFKIKVFLKMAGSNEKSLFFITQRYLENSSDEELICSIYEHGYIGYLSALYLHGMTDRFPKVINYVIFKRSDWVAKYTDVNNPISDFGKRYYLPSYPVDRKFPEKFLKISIKKDVIDFSEKNDGLIRVHAIEPLLIDCLKNPELCGGLDHVIDIFEEYGASLSARLIEYTDQKGSLMDKARIGFILEKVCDVKSNRFQYWKPQMLRGGSRIFSPKNPHSSWYDPDWLISLNHERIASYGITNSID